LSGSDATRPEDTFVKVPEAATDDRKYETPSTGEIVRRKAKIPIKKNILALTINRILNHDF